jgi:Flp pilus assembly protein TadB
MRRRTRPRTSEHSPVKLFATSVGILVAFFGLLVAATFPVVSLAALAGAASVPVARRVVKLVQQHAAVCVPGTDVCLQADSA